MLEDGSILVTGGAGFIGSAVVWALNGRGLHRIIITDVLDRSDKWRNLVPLRYRHYLEADALPAAIARGDLDDVRTVFHLGACSATTETDSAYLMRNNVDYTTMLAEWAVGRGARFVYASSAATYGAREGTLSEDLPLEELRPLNMYGYSKHLFDLRARERGYFDRIAGLKYTNVFGPNESHKGDMRSVVNKAHQQIAATGQVQLFKSYRREFADGEQRRDFIYVKDAVEMTLYAGAHPHVNGLFNVGSGTSHTWLELARAVFDAMDAPARIEFIEMPEPLRPKYQYATCAPADRLRRAGYARPFTPLRDAVSDYVRQYLALDRRLGDEQIAHAGV